MRATTSTVRLLLVAAAICAVAVVWLRYDNPEIDGTSRGDDYSCAAPYDTAAHGEAPNVPGGEPPPDSDDITARCTAAGQVRFGLSVASAALVPLALVGAGAEQLRRHRRAREDESVAQERRTASPG